MYAILYSSSMSLSINRGMSTGTCWVGAGGEAIKKQVFKGQHPKWRKQFSSTYIIGNLNQI